MKAKRFWSLVIVIAMCIGVFPSEMLAATEFTALDGTSNNDTANQGYTKLLDGSQNTKWCDRIGTVDGVEYTPYIVFKAQKRVIITSYSFVTGNDSGTYKGRNPKDWTLYGCNDYNEGSKSGGTWTVVHSVTNDTTMQDADWATYIFTIENNSGLYQYYKLVITANHNADFNLMQLAEMNINWRLAYNVTFDKNGGDTEASPRVIVSGDGLPTVNPTKNGSTFAGWYTKNGADGDWGESFTAQSTVSADTTVYAKWDEYQITYNENYGAGDNHAVLGCGDGLPAELPTRNGYEFVGWYTKNGADGDWGESFTSPSGVSVNTTVYAKWNEYQITYNENYGESASYETLGFGSGLPTTEPTRDGYEFIGWYTKRGTEGDWGVRYTSQSVVSADMTVYARWIEPITFEVIGGTRGYVTNEINEGYENLFDGKNSGADFTKWCVHENTGYLIIKAKRPVKLSAYTFITGNDNAQYNGRSPKTWTLSGSNNYNPDDDTSGTWTQIASVTDDTTIRDVNFTPYTFEADAEDAYMYYKLEITKNAGNNLLQLCGLDFEYDVTEAYAGALVYFDKNGGRTMPYPQVIAAGGGLPTVAPTRNGYEFEGWYTKNGADGDWGESYTAQSTAYADTTVYAKWIPYEITYSLNDGSTGNYAVISYGGDAPEEPVKEGKDFEGWYTADGTDGNWGEEFSASTVVSENITLYAKWGKVKITFDKNGGDTDAVPTVVEQGDGIPTTAPTRNGYEFEGWYTKNGADGDWGEEFSTDAEFGANATVYAKWQEYTITFKMNDGTETNFGVFGYSKAFPLPIPKKKNLNVSGWYTANGADNNWGSLFSASTVVTSDMSVYAKWETSHTHCICGADHNSVGNHTKEELATYKPISTSSEFYNIDSGTDNEPNYYYLTTDIILPKLSGGGYQVLSQGNVVICLNGHKLAQETYGEVLYIGRDTVTITDCVGTGIITHINENESNCGVLVENGATFNMYGGKITKNSRNAGGGVWIAGGTFNMFGGTISDNKATLATSYMGGGGVGLSHYVSRECTFNMYGGKITGNTSAYDGGGVFGYAATHTINIYGGEISGNAAKYDGGGIYCEGGNLTVKEAVINNNTAEYRGGGIYCSDLLTGEIKNSTISKNNSTDCGGGICIWSDNVSIDNCDIKENTSGVDGGGIYVRAGNTSLDMSVKNSRFYDNKATRNGGGMCLYSKTKIENTQMLRNTASNGGGIYVTPSGISTIVVSGCTIAKNKAIGTEAKGGGIMVYDGILNVQDGTEILQNSAKVGGGIYFYDDTISLKNVRISGNTVTEKGGGVYNAEESGFSVDGGVYLYDNFLVDSTEENAEAGGENTETSAEATEPSESESGAPGSDDGGAETEPEIVGTQNNLYLGVYSWDLGKINITAANYETDAGIVSSKIGVTLADKTQAFTDAIETDYSGSFVSDDLNYAVVYSGNTLKLVDGFAVTFDYGTYNEKLSVVKNTPVSKPADPSVEGKTFIGWFLDDKEYDFTEPVNRNITITARWFDEENVGISMDASNIYINAPEEGAVLSLTLYKNYVQTGTLRRDVAESTTVRIQDLNLDEENVDTISAVLLNSEDTPICDAVMLVIKLPVFNVTFNRNGGGKDAEPKVLKSDAGIPTVNPTRDGYSFGGWYTKNGTNGDWGEEYTLYTVVKSDLTVYAKWNKNFGSISFTMLDATGGIDGSEGAKKLVDKSNYTKWCVSLSDGFTNGNSIYAVMKSGEPVKLLGYTMTTGNDTQSYSERNPKSWKLYGSNDYSESEKNGTWTELVSVTDDTLLPAENYKSVHYEITNNSTKYSYYKLEITAVGSGTMMQLSELSFDYEECNHRWDLKSVTKGSCLESEYELRQCSRCGIEETIESEPPLGHNSDNEGSCTRCGKLAEVEINGVMYSDFKQAIASIESTGGSIKLIKDVDIDGGIKLEQNTEITIDLNGYILRTVKNSRAIETSNGKLNVIDSRPTSVTKLDTTNYPWKRAADSATGDNIKTYSGGVITGGGMKIGYYGNGFNMSGGTFAGCIVDNSGAAIYSSGAPVVMSGNATIRDCKGYGTHAVYMNSGTFTMNDNSLITDCGNPERCYDAIVYCLNNNTTVILNGNASIKNCLGTDCYAIQSYRDATLNANTSGVVEGMVSVNVLKRDETCTNTTSFTQKVTTNNVSTGMFYGTVNGTIDGCSVTYKMSDASGAKNYAINVVKSGDKAVKPTDPTESGKRFFEWKKDGVSYDFDNTVTSDITLTAEWISGEVDTAERLYRAIENNISPIKLLSDITVSETIDVSYPLTLDLNGYMLKYDGTDSYLFNVSEGKSLTLSNTTNSRTYKFDNTNEEWTPVLSSATGDNIEALTGGIVIGRINNSGVLNLNDCTFVSVDNVITNAGEATVNGGMVVGCGGILINNSGTINITDCYIENRNTASDKVVNTGEIYASSSIIDAVVNNSGTIAGANGAAEFSVYNNVKNSGTISWGTYYDGITNSGNGTIDGFRVHYNIGEREYAFQVLPSGSKANEPNEPDDTSYVVRGWYKDTALTQEWGFESDTVTSDITLYAKTVSSEVSTADALYAAVESGLPTVKLTDDIELSSALNVVRGKILTLDLNGHVLSFASEDNSFDNVIRIARDAELLIKDSNTRAEHKFDTSGDVWVLAADDASGSNIKSVYGGIITGGKGHDHGELDGIWGGGIENSGDLEMQGGSIIGCSANMGGGIFNIGDAMLENILIAGCRATYGGGIFNGGTTEMSNVKISYCIGVDFESESDEDTILSMGGGILNERSMAMLDTEVSYCSASLGGGVVSRGGSSCITILMNTKVSSCNAIAAGGIINMGTFAMLHGGVEKCESTLYAGGILNLGEFSFNSSVKGCMSDTYAGLYNYGGFVACGGEVNGEVYNSGGIYFEADKLGEYTGDSATVFKSRVVNLGQIMDGMFYGGIENITDENGNSGSISSSTVVYMNGNTVYAVYVTYNESMAVRPIAPVKKNCTFEGWYIDDTEYGFNEAVTDNVIVRAKWSGEGLTATPALEMTENTVSVVSNGENAKLYLGAYKQGRLVGVALKMITDDSDVAVSEFGVNISGADTLKAFLWDLNMKPLCAAAQAEIGSQTAGSLNLESNTHEGTGTSAAMLHTEEYNKSAELIDNTIKSVTENGFIELSRSENEPNETDDFKGFLRNDNIRSIYESTAIGLK